MAEALKKYTLKNEKVIDNWIFHPDYFNDDTRFLPKSMQQHIKKLIQESTRFPIDDITQIHPVIENKIMAVCKSYKNKKERSRLASQLKRVKINSAAEDESEDDTEDESDDESDDINKLLCDMKTSFDSKFRR